MKSMNEFKAGSKIKGFIGKLFEARQVAHIAHLQTNSYAAHKALGSFYESILEMIDSFIETFQGQYGIINAYDSINAKSPDSMEKYLENLAEEIKSTRQNLDEKDTHLQNMLDEMISLVYSTIYKLKYLK
jgi:hypothetical protein